MLSVFLTISCLLFFKTNWPESWIPSESNFKRRSIETRKIDHYLLATDVKIEWLHASVAKLTAEIETFNELFDIDLRAEGAEGGGAAPWRSTSKNVTIPLPLRDLVHCVTGLDDAIQQKESHYFRSPFGSITITPDQLAIQHQLPHPSTRSTTNLVDVAVVGFDDEHSRFEFAANDLRKYLSAYDLGLTIDHDENPPDASSLEATVMVQSIVGLNSNVNVSVWRYPQGSFILEFLYDLWSRNDPLPSIVLFGYGMKGLDLDYIALCEPILAQLRTRNVNFIAASGSINEWPSISPNVIAISAVTSSNSGEVAGGFATGGATWLFKRGDEFRSTPDLAMLGDRWVIVYNNQVEQIGGTIVAASLFAASLARLIETFPVVHWLEVLYNIYNSRQCADCFNDIIDGASGAGYGFDLVSGMGTINVQAIRLFLTQNPRFVQEPVTIYNPTLLVTASPPSAETSPFFLSLIVVLVSIVLVSRRCRKSKKEDESILP